jgi:hypothetical protein
VKRLVFVLVSILAIGCGPTVNGVCDDLDDECDGFIPLEDCEDDGHRLEDLAEQQGCENGFDAYLDCIDAEVCDWADRCVEVRADLDVCIGGATE